MFFSGNSAVLIHSELELQLRNVLSSSYIGLWFIKPQPPLAFHEVKGLTKYSNRSMNNVQCTQIQTDATPCRARRPIIALSIYWQQRSERTGPQTRVDEKKKLLCLSTAGTCVATETTECTRPRREGRVRCGGQGEPAVCCCDIELPLCLSTKTAAQPPKAEQKTAT